MRLRLLLAALLGLLLCSQASEPKYSKRWSVGARTANWTALLSQPSAFVAKSATRLRKRPDGYTPNATCIKHVGVSYLDQIRRSRIRLCGSSSTRGDPSLVSNCTKASECRSQVDCFTAPYVVVGNSTKAAVSFCRSGNLLLDSCKLLAGRRTGSMGRFPLPASGAVRLACDPASLSSLTRGGTRNAWLKSINHEVWWEKAVKDDAAVRRACAPGSPTLVTTPTLFVLRDRHANYAHEMEVASMAFAFLAALEPHDIMQQGVQVVIVDQAPATGFLETWARISQPHRLRLLANEPFPAGTCFRNAYHLHTFAAGIGYNTNPATVGCESPVVTGLSHWLRQLYDQTDPWSRYVTPSADSVAESVAGPEAAEAGVPHLRPPAGGIIMRNVVWLSRRNLELLRLLLDSSAGWRAMRMVRNEEAVVAALAEAVQEWNAESCMLRKFDKAVQAPSYIIGNNIVALEKLWALDNETDPGCRRSNVLFKFVYGDFEGMSYYDQLQTVFRTGVLAGVHGAGLAHGFFLPPGQSAVLQLLGESFAQVTACNVFRNMATACGHHYEDVRYSGVDVDVAQLKAAAKRAMDYVSGKAMEAHVRRHGLPRLVLVDQNHFTIMLPSQEQCPRFRNGTVAAAGGNGTAANVLGTAAV
ncbi:hypothetical protein GPECTOR_59g650 [Gonium pectorale]|uniref:Uncharacterized protein n=1 Tax=Gonium pectorale TaxID=33097 RepID=A0A150G5B1_GONPE|nr:hypothetical protein GPECTOR_59g650 [Gonium pectorale]|eukprot:KXZ45042.1 hypothetical protein GPECTOR_59g650 [Gonium pectorale]